MRQRRLLLSGQIEPCHPVKSAVDTVVEREFTREIEMALRQLSLASRRDVVAHHMEGRSLRDISRETGMTRYRVKKYLESGVAQLREELARYAHRTLSLEVAMNVLVEQRAHQDCNMLGISQAELVEACRRQEEIKRLDIDLTMITSDRALLLAGCWPGNVVVYRVLPLNGANPSQRRSLYFLLEQYGRASRLAYRTRGEVALFRPSARKWALRSLENLVLSTRRHMELFQLTDVEKSISARLNDLCDQMREASDALNFDKDPGRMMSASEAVLCSCHVILCRVAA